MLKRLTEAEAIEALRQGGVVVFPTETRYCLGCRAADPEAVARLQRAKQRPDGKPLPVLLPNVRSLERFEPETPLLGLADAFWPGPLTLIVPAFPGLASAVTADTNMVGVRVSGHPVAVRLAAGLGEPLVATSANRSGAAPTSTAAACDTAGLDGVVGIVDGGEVSGVRSTVVGFVEGALRIFQEGPITAERVQAEWARLRGD
jgi:L-threonylcarbamoyladenylate synthase